MGHFLPFWILCSVSQQNRHWSAGVSRKGQWSWGSTRLMGWRTRGSLGWREGASGEILLYSKITWKEDIARWGQSLLWSNKWQKRRKWPKVVLRRFNLSILTSRPFPSTFFSSFFNKILTLVVYLCSEGEIFSCVKGRFDCHYFSSTDRTTVHNSRCLGKPVVSVFSLLWLLDTRQISSVPISCSLVKKWSVKSTHWLNVHYSQVKKFRDTIKDWLSLLTDMNFSFGKRHRANWT